MSQDRLSTKDTAAHLSIIDKYRLDELDQRILKLKIEFPHITDEEVSEIVGITRPNVNIRRNKPAFKKAFSEINLPAREKLKHAAPNAVRKYLSLLNCGDKKVEEKVARHIMVNAGIMNLKDGQASESFGLEVIELEGDGGEVVKRLQVTRDVEVSEE